MFKGRHCDRSVIFCACDDRCFGHTRTCRKSTAGRLTCHGVDFSAGLGTFRGCETWGADPPPTPAEKLGFWLRTFGAGVIRSGENWGWREGIGPNRRPQSHEVGRGMRRLFGFCGPLGAPENGFSIKTGGAGGIRTLGTALQPYDGLANRCLQPLGHSSAPNPGSPDRTAFLPHFRSRLKPAGAGWTKIPQEVQAAINGMRLTLAIRAPIGQPKCRRGPIRQTAGFPQNAVPLRRTTPCWSPTFCKAKAATFCF